MRLSSSSSSNSTPHVSIHAPTRGATFSYIEEVHPNDWFQSTHPHGVRQVSAGTKITTVMFQSTHPHGVRLIISCFYPVPVYRFNPRTHTGCDSREIKRSQGDQCVSIHAPTRGATAHNIQSVYAYCRFNPRTHTGCDIIVEFLLQNICLFQSTHPHGVRLQ